MDDGFPQHSGFCEIRGHLVTFEIVKIYKFFERKIFLEWGERKQRPVMATVALPIIPAISGEELSLPSDVDFHVISPLSRS